MEGAVAYIWMIRLLDAYLHLFYLVSPTIWLLIQPMVHIYPFCWLVGLSAHYHEGGGGDNGQVAPVAVCLRRVDNARATPKVAAAAQEKWRRVRHPNIVCLQKCFCLHKALFFAHDYWPTAKTLTERYTWGELRDKVLFKVEKR